MFPQKIVTLATCQVKSNMANVIHLDALLRENIAVEFWNVCQCMYGKTVSHGESADAAREHEFATLESLDAELQKQDLSSTLFLAFVGHALESAPLFDLLRKHGAVVAFLENMSWYSFGDLTRQQRLRARALHPFVLAKFLWEKLTHSRTGNDSAGFDVVFYESSFRKPNSDALTIPLNSVLYEEALHSEHAPLVEVPYIVYLDTAAGAHPDQKLLSGVSFSGEEYRADLVHFFERLERDLGMPVVVAAHPKANYSGAEFGGRKIFKNQTCALAQHASLALCDCSTSALYFVALQKPLIFFVNEMMLQWMRVASKDYPAYAGYPHVQALRAEALAMPLLHINRLPEAPLQLPEVSEPIYTQETFRWLTHPGMEQEQRERCFMRSLGQIDIQGIHQKKLASS